ncbi:MFS transporter [Desulfovibrio cuneatus]|uniref:MFS transporter n=1 Tax=Desulfovibrio cuneatus TaxID=159728 RepID=UPI000406BB13|nr:MFS transporter [Desulfovibrio cuneatus]
MRHALASLKELPIPCIISLGCSQIIAWASSYYLPAVIAKPMANALGISLSCVYGAFSVALVVAALTAPFAGRCIDRFGGKKVLVLSNVLFAGGLLFLAHVQGLFSLYLAWACLGMAMGAGLYDMAFATVVRAYGIASSGIIAGITLLGGFASTVGWPLSHFLLEQFGWQNTLLVWACLHLAVALPCNMSLVLPKRQSILCPNPQVVSHRKEETDKSNIIFILLAVTFACTTFSTTVMASHMPALLHLYGVTASASIVAGMLFGPAQVSARIVQLTLLRSCNPASVAFFAALVIPLGAVSLLVWGPGAALLVGIFHGLGNGTMTIIKGTLPLQIFGKEGYGQRQGWLFLPAGIVQACAPFLFSLCIEHIGKNALFVYISCSLVAAVFFAVLGKLQKQSTRMSVLIHSDMSA